MIRFGQICFVLFGSGFSGSTSNVAAPLEVCALFLLLGTLGVLTRGFLGDFFIVDAGADVIADSLAVIPIMSFFKLFFSLFVLVVLLMVSSMAAPLSS